MCNSKRTVFALLVSKLFFYLSVRNSFSNFISLSPLLFLSLSLSLSLCPSLSELLIVAPSVPIQWLLQLEIQSNVGFQTGSLSNHFLPTFSFSFLPPLPPQVISFSLQSLLLVVVKHCWKSVTLLMSVFSFFS